MVLACLCNVIISVSDSGVLLDSRVVQKQHSCTCCVCVGDVVTRDHDRIETFNRSHCAEADRPQFAVERRYVSYTRQPLYANTVNTVAIYRRSRLAVLRDCVIATGHQRQ